MSTFFPKLGLWLLFLCYRQGFYVIYVVWLYDSDAPSDMWLCRSFFMCRVDLTDEGNRHVSEVLAIIFRYLNLLRGENGVDESIWKEMQSLSRLRFDFRDKPNPYDYASLLAHGMNIYGLESLLESSYAVPLEFDPDKIRQVGAGV